MVDRRKLKSRIERSKPVVPDADGTRSLAEIADAADGVTNPIQMVALGKQAIRDIGKRLAQIQGLKPGGTSIRTAEIVEEIIERLKTGETLTSITCDPRMPSQSALWNWRDADEELEDRIVRAQAKGQHTLADARLDIALGGPTSTGDRLRDKLVIDTINANIAQRNRAEFGEKIAVTAQHTLMPYSVPMTLIPSDVVKPENDPE
ncbi:MAG: hypothetical protein E7773_10120 [Sphingomonas sp.]|uniref:terminase small subunit-like protein n=1 Tax=Sphingomonas sp. TaxID=28214 RepID=UPI001206D745|nr:hypothetical protein [Sphingomonas sp.]THD35693.1 MAG: hypothetical protein E7773_10120 [Sphingomonas sp.]